MRGLGVTVRRSTVPEASQSVCALAGCDAEPCARGQHPTACVNTAGREVAQMTLPCAFLLHDGCHRAESGMRCDCVCHV